MFKNISLAALFCAICFILDIPKAFGKRMPTATSRPFRQETKPPKYSEEFNPQRQSPPQYSEELKPIRPKPPMYSEELKPTKTKQLRHSEETRQTRTKPRTYSEEGNPTRTRPPMYSEELKSTRAKPRTSSEDGNPTRTLPPMYSEELKSTRTKPLTFSDELQSTTPLNYGSRRQQKPKPMCGTECSKPKKRKTQIPPSQSNRMKMTGQKNDTAVVPEKPRFSYQYSPDGTPNGGGFVPIPSPSARTARSRTTEELTAKESQQSLNILGNGNFEILSGGVFAEDETNEIPQGRRVGRTGRTYDNFPFQQPRFQQMPFNVQNFQFPAFYTNRHQLPAHPLFFPRGAF